MVPYPRPKRKCLNRLNHIVFNHNFLSDIFIDSKNSFLLSDYFYKSILFNLSLLSNRNLSIGSINVHVICVILSFPLRLTSNYKNGIYSMTYPQKFPFFISMFCPLPNVCLMLSELLSTFYISSVFKSVILLKSFIISTYDLILFT